MRVSVSCALFVCSFLSLHAATPEDAVTAAYKRMEQSLRTGDGQLYLRLQPRDVLSGGKLQQRLQKGFPPDPSLRFESLGIRVKKDRAAIVGRTVVSRSGASYHQMRFILEDGAWKIAVESHSETPIDPLTLYAAVPPDDGAFGRAGSPWGKIAYATANTKFFKKEDLPWKMQATLDESFLYARFEAERPLPKPGTEVQSGPGQPAHRGAPISPGVMKIRFAPGREFTIRVSDVTQTRATFGQDGRATSNRFFVQYSLSVERDSDRDLFDSKTSDSFGALITALDRFLDIKIPLKCFGIDAAPLPRIDLVEANSLAKILPYRIEPFVK